METMANHKLFTLLQISDSAFPTGGFSHSMGLEAYSQHCGNSHNKLDNKSFFHALLCIIENTGSMSLPFVVAAFNAVHNENSQTGIDKKPKKIEPSTKSDCCLYSESTMRALAQLDRVCEACTTNHIARRASTRQGKSLLETSVSVGLAPAVTSTLSLPHCHQAVVHGAVLCAAGMPLDTTLTSFMFGAVRTLMAAAVRLDLVGAMEGQRLQCKLQEIAADVIKRNQRRTVDEACIRFPVVEILQNTHDTLFSKLFYS